MWNHLVGFSSGSGTLNVSTNRRRHTGHLFPSMVGAHCIEKKHGCGGTQMSAGMSGIVISPSTSLDFFGKRPSLLVVGLHVCLSAIGVCR